MMGSADGAVVDRHQDIHVPCLVSIVSIVADGIPPPLRFHIGGRRHRDLPDSARYVDGRHFQVVSAIGKSHSVSALSFDCLGKGLM